MNQIRSFLIVAWLALAFLLWQAWRTDHAVPVVAPAATTIGASADAAVPTIPTAPASNGTVPTTPSVPGTAPAIPATAAISTTNPPITLSNDVLRLQIDPVGASIVDAELITYGQTGERNSPPVKLLSTDPTHYFVAQSGLVSNTGAAPSHEALYTPDLTHLTSSPDGKSGYVLSGGADRIELPMVWTDASGVSVRKTWILTRGSYVVTQQEDIRNGSGSAWTGYDYRQLERVPPIIAKGGGLTNPESYSFVGAAWYSPQDKFEQRKFGNYDEPLDKSVSGGWIAMLQHYFMAAWIPPAQDASRFSIATADAKGVVHYIVRELGPPLQVAPNASISTSARLYVGPKLQEKLPQIAEGLGLTVAYGWFTVIAGPLYWLLSKLHWLLGNWGWAIVALVVLLKITFFKLSEAQYKNMAKMRALQPRLDALKERFGDDKQQYQMAMLDLYKKEKVNPAGGCLPMLIPIPIFIALYRVLLESVELRHAPWIGWIHSLTDRDPYFILPALNMLVMIATQKLSPMPSMDPMQRRMMQIMPLAMGVMFAFFPAGLVLYWVTNGALGLLQQWWPLRQHGGTVRPAKA